MVADITPREQQRQPTIKERQAQISEKDITVDLHPILKRVFANRGVDGDPMDLRLQHMPSFTLLKGIEQAVSLLVKTLEKQGRIVIVGDFDADGATSTSVAVTALKALGAKKVEYLVPNRFEYGYGLSPEIVEDAKALKPELIITVDNGIANFDGVTRAKEAGIQVLITDHHLPAESLPDADAIVNPNQPGCDFPSKNLAGVGVIFYVMLALRAKLREMQWFTFQGIPCPNLAEWLDLVAIGTIADVVPLDKLNRVLVSQGLARIRAHQTRPGIEELIQVAGREQKFLTAQDVGFALGPRLNAAGRLVDMTIGIQCLIAKTRQRAKRLCQSLHELNESRKKIEADMQSDAMAQVQQAIEQLAGQSLPAAVAVFEPHWHQGVVGIVASRIKDKLFRPVIAFAKENEDSDVLKGSGRSIAGIHLRDVLDEIDKKHPGLILKFGGHAMAAGLTIHEKDFQSFTLAFEQMIASKLTEDTLKQELLTDGVLDSTDYGMALAKAIEKAGPWGQQFPEPMFEGRFEVLDYQLLQGKHLKLKLQTGVGQKPLDAIAFNVEAESWQNDFASVHCVFRLDINRYRNRERLQLMLEYIEKG